MCRSIRAGESEACLDLEPEDKTNTESTEGTKGHRERLFCLGMEEQRREKREKSQNNGI
jgi:hypothetical protein